MKKVCLAVLMMALGFGTARAGGYDDAINTALEGPEDSHAVVGQHRFAVQPPKMEEKSKSKYTLVGKLTRLDKTPAKDDAIAYRVVREKGAVKSIEIQVNGGMWLPIRQEVMAGLGDYCKGVPMSDEKQKEATTALEKLMDGSWQKAAEFLIAHIAARHC